MDKSRLESRSGPDLLPCPFCGCSADFRWCGGVLLAECTNCHVSKGHGGDELAPRVSAAERWNQRAAASETQPSETERLKEALRLVKSWVVGEKRPNWENDTTTYLSRGKIADICDIALAHPHHPRDMHLTVEKR